MNSPRSLISTSSSGGIGIGIGVAVADCRNWCRERGAVLIRSVCVVALTTMSHVACGTIGWTIVRRQSRRPRVITQSLIQMPGHRHRQRSAIAPRLPIVPPPSPPLPFPSLCLALMLMHVRVPDIIVVRGSVCRSLSARASASASTRCGQWGTP